MKGRTPPPLPNTRPSVRRRRDALESFGNSGSAHLTDRFGASCECIDCAESPALWTNRGFVRARRWHRNQLELERLRSARLVLYLGQGFLDRPGSPLHGRDARSIRRVLGGAGRVSIHDGGANGNGYGLHWIEPQLLRLV